MQVQLVLALLLLQLTERVELLVLLVVLLMVVPPPVVSVVLGLLGVVREHPWRTQLVAWAPGSGRLN